MASGSTISRAIFSLWSCVPPPFRRWVRRRNAATERVRSSSMEVALETVRRPRLRCSPLRGGRGVGISAFCGRTGASGGRRTTRSSSAPGRAVTAVGCAAPAWGCIGFRGAAGEGAAASPGSRRRASSSA